MSLGCTALLCYGCCVHYHGSGTVWSHTICTVPAPIPPKCFEGGTFAAFVAYKFFVPLPQSWIRVDVILNCKASIHICDLM